MTNLERLAVLTRLAAVKRDADLARLARAAAERDTVKMQLDALDAAAKAARDTAAAASDPATSVAQEFFARLVVSERTRLDATLSGATEIWCIRREAAEQSFGRSEALRRLQDDLHSAAAKRTRLPRDL